MPAESAAASSSQAAAHQSRNCQQKKKFSCNSYVYPQFFCQRLLLFCHKFFLTHFWWWLWCVPSSKTRNYRYRRVATLKSHKIHARLYRLSSKLSELDRVRGLGAVLSAGVAQHAARRGSGGGGTVMGVVVVRRWAREDGVPVCGGAAELEPPQVLGVDGLVALQHFDGLLHSEPLPLTACRGRQSTT